MIYSTSGECGSGKTLLMTYMAYKDYLKGIPIYSNYKLNFSFTQLTSNFFRDYSKFPIFNATVLFDELSLYYSARRSASKRNLMLKDFIIQTRKRELKLLYSAQQLRLVDVNIRENTDGFYEQEVLVKRGKYPFIVKPETWKHHKLDIYCLKYWFYSRTGKLKNKKVIYPCNFLFDLYNTYEILKFDDVEEKKDKK